MVPRGRSVEDEGDADLEDLDRPAQGEEPLAENWQGRLIFDFNVSEASPVVKGTWVTVGHVVSLIVDGWTWGDILRTHPELTEEDIRVCLAYTVARTTAKYDRPRARSVAYAAGLRSTQFRISSFGILGVLMFWMLIWAASCSTTPSR